MELTASIGAVGGALAVGLLAAFGPVEIAITAGAVVLVLAALYGVFRRFSRVTWIGWQIPLIFALAMAIPPLFGAEEGSALIVIANPSVLFGVQLGVFALIVALVLGVSAWLRYFMHRNHTKPKGALMVCDRIFGAVEALLSVLVLIVVLLSVALAVNAQFGFLKADLPAELFANPVVSFLTGHAADLLLVSLFLLFMRAGYRLGLLKSLCYILLVFLSFLGVVGCYLLATQVGFGISFSNWIGGLIFKDAAGMASAVGSLIVTGIFFAVVFVGLMFLARLLNWCIHKATSVKAVGVIDGVLISLLFTAVFAVLVVAVNFAVYAVCNEAFDLSMLGDAAESVLQSFRAIEGYITSSPLSQAFYGFGSVLKDLLP